jgi:hypothetical protein
VRELDAQHRRLQGIEAKVAANHRVLVRAGLTVHPQLVKLGRQVRILRGDEAAVAEATEVLGGEEGERSHQSNSADVLSAEGGAPGLRAVLDDRHAGRGLHDGVDVRRLTEEVNRNYGLGPRRDAPSQLLRIHAVVHRIDIHEDRFRAKPGDNARRGEEGEGRDHHLVAGLDTERHESGEQRVGPRGDADGVSRTELRGCLPFELFHLGAQDEPLRLTDSIDGPPELVT